MAFHGHLVHETRIIDSFTHLEACGSTLHQEDPAIVPDWLQYEYTGLADIIRES
jgi:hypothetical protein